MIQLIPVFSQVPAPPGTTTTTDMSAENDRMSKEILALKAAVATLLQATTQQGGSSVATAAAAGAVTTAATAGAPAPATPATGATPLPANGKYDIIVRPMHGLSNRIRALMSARMVAAYANRRLVIVWIPDPHCQSPYDQLFAVDPNEVISVDENIISPTNCLHYDYMDPAQKYKLLDTSLQQNLCVTSAYHVFSKEVNAYGEQAADFRSRMRNMAFSPQVQAIIDQHYVPAESIGLHIRSLSMQGDVPGIEKIKDKRMDFAAMSPDTVNEVRASCVWYSFLPSIRKYASDLEDPVIIVGSDTGETPIGGQIPYEVQHIMPPEKCYKGEGRSIECQQYALATVKILSKAKVFIGSQWSSYTEISHAMSLQQEQLFGCVKPYSPGVTEILPGYSVAMACLNRETFQKSVDYALQTAANEVVAVDFGSEPPLELKPHPKVTHIYVAKEKYWNLGRANNIAIKQTKYDKVLKMDCDTQLEPNFFEKNILDPGYYISGDYSGAHGSGEEFHLNGIMYVRRADWNTAGGYEERLTTYGWDDSDMYGRLQNNAKVQHKNLDYSTLQHMPHENSKRSADGASDYMLEVRTQRNRVCTETASPIQNVVPSIYTELGNNTIIAAYKPYSIYHSTKCISERESEKIVLWGLFSPTANKNEQCKNTYWQVASAWAPDHTPLKIMVDVVRRSTCVYSRKELVIKAKSCLASWNSATRSTDCIEYGEMCGMNHTQCVGKRFLNPVVRI